ncbi:MAG: class II fructose-1,6-bisphosphate aldolase [Desulfuromonadales bacterium]|nr:class II fructose-1,6-bisphosphate aldolase [Desulfuromonadales bacterium]NIR33400.1 class II fructose-1,6-bisphosphate aldolase [Desulfuromonadales bacterium]NIS43389.1 class II fructose-1,6-bisphosphate aldolase [Desulfuromonadales bacterium]
MSDRVHYSELGLVNSRELFQKAVDGGYAIPAYNFNNLEQLQSIVTACSETNSPVIIQVSKGARNYANETMLRYMAMGAVQMAREMGSQIPIVLHLDHGDSFELCKSCIDSGFSSVMIDGSHHSFEENIALTRQVVEYARQFDVTVEGEESTYTKPEEVEEFVEKTGVDSLAISIGTSHGAYKFKVAEGEEPPPLRFDILEEVERRVPGFPIVLHGASSVVPEYVELINRFGGRLEGAVGVSEEQLRRAARSAVCKINIDSDGRLAVTAKVREYLAENPGEFDPRKYLGAARNELIRLIKHKNETVLGSAGRV